MSRYAKARIKTDGAGVRYMAGRRRIARRDWPDNRVYTVGDGDTLWGLAHEMLGSVQLWWIIADFNGIHDPTQDLAAGTRLVVPSARTVVEELL